MNEGDGYTILIKRSAEKELDRVPTQAFKRLMKAILRLEANPRPKGSKKLRGVQDYRLRAGEYRVLYSIDDRNREVEIVAVGHRRDVYRA